MTRNQLADRAMFWLVLAIVACVLGVRFDHAVLGTMAAALFCRWGVARIIAAVEAGQTRVEDFGQHDGIDP